MGAGQLARGEGRGPPSAFRPCMPIERTTDARMPNARTPASLPDDAPAPGPGWIIAVGASAGGLEAVGALLRGLPADLDAAVCVVLHVAPSSPGRAPAILARTATLPVAHAVDGEAIVAGRVYVAPPDHHLVLEPGVLRLTRGPRENRQRPAVDTLFRSAAYVYGPRVIGVVLSGALDDGTAGLWTVKDRGGVAVVQDPDEAAFAWMPRSAAEYVQIDHVAPAAELGPLLGRLARRSPPHEGARPVSHELDMTTRIASGEDALRLGIIEAGGGTPFTCPDCAGVLVRLGEGGVPAFRCHTGHAYSLDSLLAANSESTHEALWSALRAVEETLLLLQHAAGHARERGDAATAGEAVRQAEAVQRRVDLLRTIAEAQNALSHESLDVPRAAARAQPGSNGDGRGAAEGAGAR